MAREFEIIGAGAIAGLLHRKKHALPPGTACPNCGAVLQGLYCHVCGQSADDHHRSIGHLIWEGVEGLTHLDGRLAQTLPPLFFDPGRLARDHFEGRRQRHVPPFRLFLISLLIFMVVLEAFFNGTSKPKPAGAASSNVAVHGNAITLSAPGTTENVVFATPVQAHAVLDKIKQARAAGRKVDVTTAVTGQKDVVAFKINGQSLDDASAADAAEAVNKAQGKQGKRADRLEGWLNEHIKRAAANKEYYSMVLFTWAHRLAVLLLPILAGLLALVYVRRRRFFIYDHLIVAMQFLSFEFLVFAVAWLIPDPVRGWALLAAAVWTPINLYMALRGAYGSRRITAVVKALFLWVSTMTLFGVLMLGLMALALAEM